MHSLDLPTARKHWIARMESAIAGHDALLSPTTPITAPTIASVAPANGIDAAADAKRDEKFFRLNGLLLRNTSVVNCWTAAPCHYRATTRTNSPWA